MMGGGVGAERGQGLEGRLKDRVRGGDRGRGLQHWWLTFSITAPTSTRESAPRVELTSTQRSSSRQRGPTDTLDTFPSAASAAFPASRRTSGCSTADTCTLAQLSIEQYAQIITRLSLSSREQGSRCSHVVN
jgi:hypothetical protein